MHLTRLATPEDVAAAVAFLAGPDAETITGILRPVDSGSSTAARATSLGWRPGRWGHVQSPRCPTTKICSTRSATVLPG
jgi:hypothetical protein